MAFWVPLSLTVHALAIGVATAVLGVIWATLWQSTGGYWGFPWYRRYYTEPYYVDQCLMAPLDTDGNICAYVTVAAGFSILLSVFLFTWQAVRWYQRHRTRQQTRPGPLSGVDATLCALAVVWWIPAAVVATIYGQRADDDGLEKHTARTAVWGLSWAALGLFCILTLVQLAGRALESPKPRPGPIQMAAPPAASPAVYPASPSPTHISGRPVPASPFLSYSPVYAPPPYPPPQYSAEPFVPIPMATEPPPFRPAP